MHNDGRRVVTGVENAIYGVGVLFISAIATDGWALTSLGLPIAPSNVLLPILLALLVLRGGRVPLPSVKVAIALVTAVLLAIGACFFALDTLIALFRVMLLGFYGLLAVVIMLLGRIERFAYLPLAALLLVVVFGGFVFFIGEVTFASNRFSLGEDYNPTWFAAMLSALAIAAACYFGSYGKAAKVLFLFCILGAGFLALATQGRNALLSVVASLVAASIVRAYVGGDVRTRVRAFALFGAALLFGVFVAHFRYAIADWLVAVELIRLDRVALLLTGDSGQATAGRIDIWLDYIDFLGNGGLIPAGPNEAALASGIYRPTENGYLAVLVDFGVPMLLLWLAFHIRLVVRTARYLMPLPIALAFFPILLSLGNDVIYYKYYWYSVGLILAVIINMQKSLGYLGSSQKH